MRVNCISDNNTNFRAHFVNDSKGLYKTLKETYSENMYRRSYISLLNKLERTGENQELEILSMRCIINGKKGVKDKIIRVLNRSNGNTEDFFIWSKGEPFWEQLTENILESGLIS